MTSEEVRELAFAKVNLVLHVAAPREDGMHPLCSLFCSIDLADELTVRASDGGRDVVRCQEVPGENLVTRALSELRAEAAVPPLEVEIEKRIPIAAGLGGGSADAAAALRAANRVAGDVLDVAALRQVGARVGADVPSQVEPAHALVTGIGETVNPVSLPAMAFVLVPQEGGLPTGEVYAELDRTGRHRTKVDPESVGRVAEGTIEEIATAIENDLEPAALSLRPELTGTLDALREAGALAAGISGSGPTAFGLFAEAEEAEAAASSLPGALVVRAREAR
jgi:4-diphosphocytidyl-2-C-methyl-D-erythritol kinase